MKKSFTALVADAHAHTGTATTDTSINTFLKARINDTLRFIYGDFRTYLTTKEYSFSTVASTQFYDFPPDFVAVDSLKITVNDVTYTLTNVPSIERWNDLNAVQFSGTAIPSYFFVRRDDIGIYPTPQAVYTSVLSYHYMLKDLTADDYTTGTATFTLNSATVTGSGTTWTAAMVGRWIKNDATGLWYRISGFTSTTSITIDRVYVGATEAGATYTIGEVPELPADIHHLISYRAASLYFASLQEESSMASFWMNMFLTEDPTRSSMRPHENQTGGYLGAKVRYSSSSEPGIITTVRNDLDPFTSRLWGSSIT